MICHTEQVFTSELTIKLRNFGTEQEALCRELLAAKQLGICKITTSENGKPVFKSLASMLRSGNDIIKTDIILTRSDSKVRSSSKMRTIQEKRL